MTMFRKQYKLHIISNQCLTLTLTAHSQLLPTFYHIFHGTYYSRYNPYKDINPNTHITQYIHFDDDNNKVIKNVISLNGIFIYGIYLFSVIYRKRTPKI